MQQGAVEIAGEQSGPATQGGVDICVGRTLSTLPSVAATTYLAADSRCGCAGSAGRIWDESCLPEKIGRLGGHAGPEDFMTPRTMVVLCPASSPIVE